ncbi:MAG: agmatine deiminase family protein [Bacteroidales bacterium]|nr:agmatine deiminase family protein [Bacteroidales bacterium]
MKIKKIILVVAMSVLTSAAMAQVGTMTKEMKDAYRAKFHNRMVSAKAKSSIPLGETVAAPSLKGQSLKSLPSDRIWFPGEWEEMKAIVVTPSYTYIPWPQTSTNRNWIADPLVSHYADYQSFSNLTGWQSTGNYGDYMGIMDTTDFITAFYLMDAIQEGGAEAWVHVERKADSAIVLRTLQRMNLRNDNVRFIVGPGNSFWYRDCGPICFYYGDEDSVAMMDFEYYTGRALDDSLPSLIHHQMGIPNYITSIEWEGGNCLVDGVGMVFSSDEIYNNNADTYGQYQWDGRDYNSLHIVRKNPLTKAQLKAALQSLIGQRATYILPKYKYDGGTGHVDLYADAWDENGFVFSIMPDNYSSWTDYRTGQKNIDSLCSYSSIFGRDYYIMGTLPFPLKNNCSNFASQIEYNNKYTRTYSNHTFVNNLIIQPCFSAVGSDGMPTAAWDRANIEKVKQAYPGYRIYCVDVREFDGSGGAIHCITKQIPADNPIRILHKNIHGCVNAVQDDVPVSAIITNKSGIASASCVYRVAGGEWDTVSLTANSNRFYGNMPHVNSNFYRDVVVNDTTIAVADSIAVVDTTYNADSTVMTFDTTYVYSYDTTYSVDTVSMLVDTTITVEYYISATSNNGKTITKPMTASQGGYYSYYYTNYNDTAMTLDSSFYDFDTTPMPMDNITFLFSTDWTEVDDSEPLAINNVDASDEDFGQFYPNPSSDKANMKIDLRNGADYVVTIIDVNGRTVHTSRLQAAGTVNYTINTSKLASGVYHVVFVGDGRTVTRKLMVR